LTVKAAGRLRRNGFFASDFALSVRQADGMKYKFSMAYRLISPAQDNFSFLTALDNLWQDMLDTLNPNLIKKVAVTLTGLYQNNQITTDLFAQDYDDTSGQSEKFQNLSLAMDKINQKFGAEAVRLGISPKTQAGYVGTKIAFHRIPDLAEFQE
jgi:DNA polymerase-4